VVAGGVVFVVAFYTRRLTLGNERLLALLPQDIAQAMTHRVGVESVGEGMAFIHIVKVIFV
jgi:hypothetical protein